MLRLAALGTVRQAAKALTLEQSRVAELYSGEREQAHPEPGGRVEAVLVA